MEKEKATNDKDRLFHQLGDLERKNGERLKRDLDGFKELFEKYLTSEAIDWDKIEKLPEGAVSI